jgi:hypothetical protein
MNLKNYSLISDSQDRGSGSGRIRIRIQQLQIGNELEVGTGKLI